MNFPIWKLKNTSENLPFIHVTYLSIALKTFKDAKTFAPPTHIFYKTNLTLRAINGGASFYTWKQKQKFITAIKILLRIILDLVMKYFQGES